MESLTGSARLLRVDQSIKSHFQIADSETATLRAAVTMLPARGNTAGSVLARSIAAAALGDVVGRAKDIGRKLTSNVKAELAALDQIEADGLALKEVARFLRGDRSDLPEVDPAIMAAAITVRKEASAASVARAMDSAVEGTLSEARRIRGEVAERVISAAQLVGAKSIATVTTAYGHKSAPAAQRLADWLHRKHAERFSTRRRASA